MSDQHEIVANGRCALYVYTLVEWEASAVWVLAMRYPLTLLEQCYRAVRRAFQASRPTCVPLEVWEDIHSRVWQQILDGHASGHGHCPQPLNWPAA